MERNKWETAILCLEVALHPNTNDAEVIAAVNGFRRTASGTPLREICIELVGGGYADRGRVAGPVGWREEFDRLNRENIDLRRKLEVQETSQITIIRRLRAAEQRVRDRRDELLAAQARAGAAEQRLAEVLSSLDDLNHENLDLRRALEQARHSAAGLEARAAAAPFRKFLDEARLRTDQMDNIATHRPTTPYRGRESSGSPNFSVRSRRPWTA